MAAKTYLAVVQHAAKPDTLDVLASGTKPQCEGAVDMWTRRILPTLPDGADVRAVIVVEAS